MMGVGGRVGVAVISPLGSRAVHVLYIYTPLGRPTMHAWMMASVCHPIHAAILMPLRSPTGSVVKPYGLTGLAKGCR